MMDISQKIIEFVNLRDEIRQAIGDKGVDMTGIVPLSEYPAKIASIMVGEFPGYTLKTGSLCSKAATSGTNNGGGSYSLAIPAGCIPLGVKIEGNFSISSGKGESPYYYLEVKDNNNKVFYQAYRPGGSGSLSNNSKQIFINPLAAYDGDLATASTIASITVASRNGSGNLISDYVLPKATVIMWLEANV